MNEYLDYNNSETFYEKRIDPRELNVVQRISDEASMKAKLLKVDDSTLSKGDVLHMVSIIAESAISPTSIKEVMMNTSDELIIIMTDGTTRNLGSIRGPQGLQGPKGDKGDTGSQGLQGPQGATGPQGPTGPQGTPGATGPKGDKGDTGATGPQGPQGIQGEAGPKGDTGSVGPQGDPGDKGDKGEQGPAGYTPVRGTDYWTPEDVSAMEEYIDQAIADRETTV